MTSVTSSVHAPGAAMRRLTTSPTTRSESVAFDARETLDAFLAESWHNPDGDVWYQLLRAEQVDRDVAAAAHVGQRFASLHLQIDRPPLRFFTRETELHRAYRNRYGVADWCCYRWSGDPAAGYADRRRHLIGVTVELPWPCAVDVAAHECHHLARPRPADIAQEESDATAYGAWVRDLLVTDAGLSSVHRFDGAVYSYDTLQGAADELDVLVNVDGSDTPAVFRNFGDRTSPRWLRHHVSCPVPTTPKELR